MKKIPLVRPQFDSKKLCKSLKEISETGILTKGPYLAKFEGKLKNYLKVKYVFATSSCTTALHLALLAAGIGDGDEVLVSDFSFPATGNAVCYTGAKPIFVDINLKGLCIDVKDLKRKITTKTKAILIVHAFGYPCQMDEIMDIAKKNKLVVIEDAACALGSKFKNKPLGSIGDLGCFSFHPRKNITTGEGGAIVTDNPKFAQKIEILRNHGGVVKNKKWEFIEIGFNYRLSEFQAALGVEEMPKVDKITHKRKVNALRYEKLLKGVHDLILPQDHPDGIFNYQSYVVILPKKYNRDKIIEMLQAQNIETVLGTYAMHSQKSFRQFGYKPGDLPNSYLSQNQSLTLPLYPQMSETEIKYVAKNLIEALQNA